MMMAAANPEMMVSYDPLEVALSVIIAVSASYAALDLAGRVRVSGGGRRLAWLACGAIAMGNGIWAMHFVGMVAVRLPVAIAFYWPTAVASLIAAIFAAAGALHIVSRRDMGTLYAWVGGSILAAGIVTLHYTNMGAMRLAARCEFNPFLVSLSVVFAIVFALGGLRIEFLFRDARRQKMAWRRIGSALAMGAAISAMHYTGMASATYRSSVAPPDLTHAVNVSSLSTIGIAVVTLILLGSVIIASLVDRGFSAQALLLALSEARLEVAREARLEIMGELTASIAHEINQPLTAIVTNGEFCLRNLSSGRPDQKRLREAVTEIVHDGNRASSIISRIRALMKGAHEHAQLDINNLIQKVLDLTQNEITSNHISLRTNLAADLPLVRGDPIQLQQVLINLVTNSIDAMRGVTNRPRELLIRSARSPDGVLIEVQDSGSGVDPDELERIFEPFFTTKQEGLGMGLSISRSIIESHGGRLGIVPSSTGALFEFTLPTDDAGVS
jgi:NO-binding membrane sensor protein with MHYT domain/nitrogen-specific signal transduction histidine kinase